jgi:hypothetical protein
MGNDTIEKEKSVTGELIAETEVEDLAASKVADIVVARPAERTQTSQGHLLRYIALPVLFTTVALLGGLRLSGLDSSFIFVKPPLLCLIFAAIMLALFFRSGLIQLHGWLAEDFPLLKNFANAAILASLFAATTQLFNSLIPERGLPFWIVSFCFFWTLWNNLFAEFDTKKLLRSLGALFGLAFVIKYLVLANLAAPAGRTWFERLTENPGQEAMTWLLDLPSFSAGTGYIQFFAGGLYLLGLFLLPGSTRDSDRNYEI